MNNLKYLAFLPVLFCLVPTCLTLTCEKINELSGIVRDTQSTQGVVTKCWTIEVSDDSYVRLDIQELSFSSRPCDERNLKIHVAGTNETYTYCAQDSYRKPVTALSDVNITFYHNGYNGYYYGYGTTSSFKLNYTIENLICAQKNHFRCSDFSCIHLYQVCDGVKDCENGDDEVGCDKGITGVRGVNVSRENAINWLKSQRSAAFGWGKNTHRAITALYLAKGATFTGEILEEELMVKQLELQTSVALLRNSTDVISVAELSMYVNALTVTCHNPRQFYGHDLLKILKERVAASQNPSPSAYLTLCNANWTASGSDVKLLLKQLQKESKYPFMLDVKAMAVMSLTCMKNKINFANIASAKVISQVQSQSAERIYNNTIQKFIAGQHPDGSFGNVYTTALVTQALISSGQESNKKWNLTATAQYLMQQLNSSSVDFLSTYLVLPIFKGRTLVDIATVNCSNTTRKQGGDNEISDVTNKLGGKMQVQYSLFVGDQRDVIHTILLRMPENSTAYDVMRVAQVADPKYKFLHRDVSGQMYVYEIAGITNDPEAGKFWLLYTGELQTNATIEHHITSPDELILGDSSHLIMWYKTADI